MCMGWSGAFGSDEHRPPHADVSVELATSAAVATLALRLPMTARDESVIANDAFAFVIDESGSSPCATGE
jgi:hypothetical protein